MIDAARHLHVVDGHGELDTDSVPIPSDVALLVEEVIDLRRKVAALKGQITKLRKVDPRASEISEVLEYWLLKCKGNSPRVKVPLDGSRAKAVSNMLKLYDVYQLKRAIDALAAFPWAQYDRRYCEAGPGRVRRDELEVAFRDERHVEALLALSDGDEEHKAYRRFVHGLIQQHPLIVAALAMLGQQEPHGSVLASAAKWAAAKEAEAA